MRGEEYSEIKEKKDGENRQAKMKEKTKGKDPF